MPGAWGRDTVSEYVLSRPQLAEGRHKKEPAESSSGGLDPASSYITSMAGAPHCPAAKLDAPAVLPPVVCATCA